MRAAVVLAVLAVLVACAACSQPSDSSNEALRPSEQLDAFDLAGDWSWTYQTDERDTSRTEEEQWRLSAHPDAPAQLTGRYVRTVTVHALGRTPFQCNQRPWYRQRTSYDVVVDRVGPDLVIRETSYATEPSPCDHGFRHLGTYHAPIAAGSLALRWGDGTDAGLETLVHLAPARTPLPPPAWATTYAPTGAWRWTASSVDATGRVRDETEWWDITRRSETRLDVTYRRRVTVRSADGTTPIACAGGPSWTFDDAYVLDGEREEDHWHFHELAVEAGDHPCLRATPRRTLDEATAEQIGDFFVLEWRGKRREILYRPELAAGR